MQNKMLLGIQRMLREYTLKGLNQNSLLVICVTLKLSYLTYVFENIVYNKIKINIIFILLLIMVPADLFFCF